ncbi:MAG TPA: hypothetical protein VF576_01650 [Rubricoccaceae bacterium]|jgi:hypothetical protein
MSRSLIGGALALLLAGCLPSTQRRNDRSVPASDSASVAFAETVASDTLALIWEAGAPTDGPMPYPTTIAWVRPDSGGAARLVVAETQEASLRLFTPDGQYAGRVETGGGPESFPYLAGVRRDSAVMLERGTNRLAFVPLRGGPVRRIPAPAGATAALATDSSLYVRTGGGAEEEPAFLVRLDERGRPVSRHAFSGQPWRASGFLREWGGTVVALSGYRPVLDRLGRGARPGSRLDTLALRGFSSPQLPRSAQFMRGDVDQPPLLTSSAAAHNGDLYLLNLRDEHVRLDVYGPQGTLQRVLVSPGPWSTLAYVPVDVAIRSVGGTIEFAVLMQRADGLIQTADSRVVLYRHTPAGPAR